MVVEGGNARMYIVTPEPYLITMSLGKKTGRLERGEGRDPRTVMFLSRPETTIQFSSQSCFGSPMLTCFTTGHQLKSKPPQSHLLRFLSIIPALSINQHFQKKPV